VRDAAAKTSKAGTQPGQEDTSAVKDQPDVGKPEGLVDDSERPAGAGPTWQPGDPDLFAREETAERIAREEDQAMARLYQGSDWRFGIARSRMLAMVWSAEAQHAQMQRQKLAYAMALRKPIRLLVLDGTRLPEDLCTGYADVQVARVSSARAAGQQIQDWLEGLPEPPDSPTVLEEPHGQPSTA
jgi:hypothetical protein